MNFLTEPLPDFILSGSERLKIKTDFRIWIEVGDILMSIPANKITKIELSILLENIADLALIDFPEEINEEFFLAVVDFYTLNERTYRKKQSKDHQTADHGKTQQLYDYEFDSGAIHASFLQQYGIRLIGTKMHWFEFQILLANLGDDTPFKKRIKIRQMKSSDVPKNKISDLNRLKELYKIPVPEDEIEISNKTADILMVGRNG